MHENAPLHGIRDIHVMLGDFYIVALACICDKARAIAGSIMLTKLATGYGSEFKKCHVS